MRIPPESLEWRFKRLRSIVSEWEIRYNQLPEQVISSFEAFDMDSIQLLAEERRNLERLIPEMQEFISRWEEC